MDNEYIQHWDDKFKKRSWGRYPPEDLVRFFGRNFKKLDPSKIDVLEIGCGPGANLWFMHREGFKISGIDGSSTAIDVAKSRLDIENAGMNSSPYDLRVGDFSKLPWTDQQFDVVVDVFALYSNLIEIIQATIDEVYRVLTPGGWFYSKLWGKNCTGYGEGEKLEVDTFTNIPTGPCANMGITHFFDEDEIRRFFSKFEIVAIDKLSRSDSHSNSVIEEYLCQFRKL